MKGVHATHRSVEAARGGCIYTQQIGRAHLAHPDIYSSTSVPCDSIGVSVLLFNQIEHCWSRGGGSGGDTAGLALNKRFFKDEHHRHSVQVHVWSHYPTGR